MKNLVPKRRFEEFKDSDHWEQRKLGEMGKTFTGLSGKMKDDFGHGDAEFVTYMNIFSNSLANIEQTENVEIDERQNEVEYGDIFFTTSSETPEEVGMSSVWLGNKPNVYLNSFCFGYRPTGKLDSYYMAYMLRSSEVRKKFQFLAQGISRYNISKTKVMELYVFIPKIEEQAQIGQFFNNLDNLITLHQRKLDKLKETKSAYLSEMFPKDGEFYPKRRFVGFTDPWEQRKLGDVAGLTSSKRVHAEDYVDSGIPFYRGKEISELKEHKIVSEVLYISEDKYNDLVRMYGSPKTGDLLMTAVGTLGNTWVVDNVPFYFKDGNLIWFKNIKCNPKYLDYVLSSEIGQKRIMDSAIGSNQKALTMIKLNELTFMFPNVAEQEKISKHFTNLDHLITLHQRKLDKLQALKQAYLSEMFV